MKIKVVVTLKNGVLDPQGKVVGQTLKNMGYGNISNIRQGKFFEIDMFWPNTKIYFFVILYYSIRFSWD